MNPTEVPITGTEAALANCAAEPLRSLWQPLRDEWRWCLPVAVFTFFLASIFTSGWPNGLIPNMTYPFVYGGDGLSYSWMTERAIEGWIFNNPRSGYPFGSDFTDYPGSDGGNLLLLKLFGLFGGNYAVALNLFYLLSFPAVFLASFAVLRAIRLSRPLTLCGSVLFTCLPFHFFRLPHLFYVWYFVVPLFFYAAFIIHEGRPKDRLVNKPWWRNPLLAIGFIVLASFGVYYAAYGILVLAAAGFAGWARANNARSLRLAVLSIAMVAIGVLINTAPNVASIVANGKNSEVAARLPSESEIYGLKLIQMIMPRRDHRIKALAEATHRYSLSHPLINENMFAALGVVGALGLASLGLVAIASLGGRRIDQRLGLISAIVLTLFAFGTIGGLGSVFAEFVSASLRGWNRISVFIGFGALAAVLLVLQSLFARVSSPSGRNVLLMSSALLLTAIGLFDQTIPACLSCNEKNKEAYISDGAFVQKIESLVPAGGAIYQLPYVSFPENGPLHELDGYAPAVGFLHSKTLHWSFAGMRGRTGDLFYRALAQEPLQKQLDVLRRLGFNGIYVDRRGYADKGAALISELTSVVGEASTFPRPNGDAVFFRLDASGTVDLSGLDATRIMRKAGYLVDKFGPRYEAARTDGIDFTRKGLPEFIRAVDGLSFPEPWGRWSDASIAPEVRIDFFDPLPDRFTLVLKAQSFGPNAGHDLRIQIGAQEYRVTLQVPASEFRVSIDLKGQVVSRIDLISPMPTSPAQLGMGTDPRKLGAGLIHLKIAA